MAKLNTRELNQSFVTALGNLVRAPGDLDGQPLELALYGVPPFLRVYLWNASNPPGGRTRAEHKIQLTLPGQPKGDTGYLDFSGSADVTIVGKVEDEDAFVLWDAYLHPRFQHSSNVQVPSDSVYEAIRDNKIVTFDRRVQLGDETIIIAPTEFLPDALRARFANRYTPRWLPRGALPPRPDAPRGGQDYRTPPPARPRTAGKARVFMVDPDEVDRYTAAHKSTQNRLADAVRRHGLVPLSPAVGDPQFDVAWMQGATAYVAEVKSLTNENEERQLRLGLGQVLSYAHLLDWPNATRVQPVLAVEGEPNASYWKGLCAKLGVILTWPDKYDELF